MLFSEQHLEVIYAGSVLFRNPAGSAKENLPHAFYLPTRLSNPSAVLSSRAIIPIVKGVYSLASS